MKKLKITAAILAISMGTTGFASSALAEYGALAFYQDQGRWGSSYGYPDRRSAERRALDECGHRRCKIAVWYRDGCGAIAMGSTGGAGWAWAGDVRDAEDDAIDACYDVDRNCDVLVSSCSWD
jgi:serine/threonine-protein kinase